MKMTRFFPAEAEARPVPKLGLLCAEQARKELTTSVRAAAALAQSHYWRLLFLLRCQQQPAAACTAQAAASRVVRRLSSPSALFRMRDSPRIMPHRADRASLKPAPSPREDSVPFY